MGFEVPKFLLSLSAVSLIIINLIPMIGVYFWGWNQGELLLLYWSESGIVGFYTILKMLLSEGMPKDLKTDKQLVNIKKKEELTRRKFFIIPFFIVHFGMFMLGHLFFLVILIIGSLGPYSLSALLNLLITFVGLFLSHGFSFYKNYWEGEEYKRADVGTLMFAPYTRIVAMQLAIILGALLQMPLAVLIIGKIVLDTRGHLWEREILSAKT